MGIRNGCPLHTVNWQLKNKIEMPTEILTSENLIEINENMELKQRIIRNLEWANKRLKLQGKGLDETQLEIIEFCLLHDLQQLTISRVSDTLIAWEQFKKANWYESEAIDVEKMLMDKFQAICSITNK